MTRYTRRIAHLSALASSLLLAGAPTASGDALLATSPSPMGARAHGDRVVWGELSDGGWQLKTLQDGLPADLPISRFQGDQRLHLNVGPGEDGTPALVYPRCGHTQEGGVTSCDVFRYDFGSQVESPVGSVNTPGAVESAPSIWGRRIAFARRVPGRSRPVLYLAPSREAGHAKRVAGGSVPGVTFVKAVVLSRRGLFFVALRTGGRQREQVLYRIWRGRRTVLQRQHYTGLSQAGNLGAPAVIGNHVYFSMTLPARSRGARTVLARINLRSRKRSLASPPALFARRGGVASLMRFRGSFLLETYGENTGPGLIDGNCFPSPPSARCTLRQVDRLTFRAPAD